MENCLNCQVCNCKNIKYRQNQKYTQTTDISFLFISGAFFIPYIIFLCLCGLPLFFMETAYGQFSSLSPIAIWRICPLFKGKYKL